jgi:hypothetical protein
MLDSIFIVVRKSTLEVTQRLDVADPRWEWGSLC